MDSVGSQAARVRNGLALLMLTAGLVAISLPRDAARGTAEPHGAVPDAPPSADPARSHESAPIAPAEPSADGPAPSSSLDAPAVTLLVRVVFLDALTGREVPGVRWVERARPGGAEGPTPLEEPLWRAGGDSAVLALPSPGLEVRAPEGYVHLPTPLIPSHRIPGAVGGVLTVLLHPEANVRFDGDASFLLLDIVGGADFDAEARIGGHRIRLNASNESGTPARLRGIPFLPGETLRLIVKREGGDAGHGAWCGTAATGGVFRARAEANDFQWVGRLGASPEEPIRLELTVGAAGRTTDADEEDREGAYGDLGYGSLPGESSATPMSFGPVDMTVHGPVRLQLLDRSGSPVPGVRVAVRSARGRTGKDGRITLPGVVGGEHAVRILDEGFAFPSARVTVASEAGADLVVRELVGGALEVRVQDFYGEPIPRAALSIVREDRRSWWDVNDAGVARLDPYVGADGRRVLSHVPPGVLHVRAKVGSREGQARVEIVDGARQVVTIELPRHPPAPP